MAVVPTESPALKRAFMAGRHAHPDLALDFEPFAAAAARAAMRRLEKLGLAHDADALESAWASVRGPDLYLAQACEADLPGAWDQLHATYADRLTAVAHRQGLRGADGEALSTEVLAELALPPSSGETRTRLGSFGGACTLAGWMAVVLTRRIAARARRKRPTSLEAAQGGEDHSADPAERRPSDPVDSLVDEEVRRRLGEAFTSAWAGLTPKERLALVAKYRDGRKQKEIAALLSRRRAAREPPRQAGADEGECRVPGGRGRPGRFVGGASRRRPTGTGNFPGRGASPGRRRRSWRIA